MSTRRTFLKQGSLAMLGLSGAIPRGTPLGATSTFVRTPADRATHRDASDVRALALRALDAARAAGATYADVRLTRTLTESYTDTIDRGEWERLGVGVRALVNGYWGFAASPYWQTDDVVRIANDAVSQAKVYAMGTPRTVDFHPIPVATGSWATPVRYDPFTIPIEEKCDFAGAWVSLARQFNRHVSATHGMSFVRQERAVATTDGAYFTQTLYESSGSFTFILSAMQNGAQTNAQTGAQGLQSAGAGWELMLDAKIPDQFPRMLEDVEAQLRGYPTKPGDIGRYDVVFDAASMAHILDRTIGTATQLDQAMGYEANAGGTSYLGPHPEQFLGTAIASNVVNVSANRSLPKGLATVRWDDEGVEPAPFSLIKDGTLIDYQTTREQAAWLASWYQKQHMPMQSHGCAGADSALSVTMQHAPNLALDPSPEHTSFDDLVAGTKRGLAIMGAQPEVSFNAGEGVIRIFHRCREIVDGKLGKDVVGLAPLFTSKELWKNVVAVGGADSVETFASGSSKGEPSQYTSYSVQAVPAKVTNVACIHPEKNL